MLKKATDYLRVAHLMLFKATAETPSKHKQLHNKLYKLDDEIRNILKVYYKAEAENNDH